eukprot:TRINITY_DN42273_c0_g1_i1.p1 TRINITY_DN42273_c0_g1~~TRINITY_DN42273_c0_g1_i1.p1  ORF type:complete len:546 (-),score=75.63 TRINITY_DN42273_c0_g1_i1:71-1708(-)
MDCPVCFESYSRDVRSPQVLLCGHTVCQQCVAVGPKSTRISCPLCRASCGTEDVRTNFALRDVLAPGAAPLKSGSDRPCVAQSVAPQQHSMEEPLLPSAPELEPWDVGPENMYNVGTAPAHPSFHAPNWRRSSTFNEEWQLNRTATLREWGRRREETMHRRPKWLMDQMVSGSGLYPPRLLDDSWFSTEELAKVAALEVLLERTSHARDLARDMMTPLIYGIEVKIVLDNSGSMQLDMFGKTVDNCVGGGSWIDSCGWSREQDLSDLLSSLLPLCSLSSVDTRRFPSPISPNHRRWFFARDALRRWMQVFEILGIDPEVILLNGNGFGFRHRGSGLESIFAGFPSGSTPMTETLEQALYGCDVPGKTTLLLVVTDGEANNMRTFNNVLDRAQNGVYGDVQICFMGLSLRREDVEWFENEECDETRIRTVEAYEVEQFQIQSREVVRKEDGYNFEMHTFRVLVTNYFPADYDYEAPLQNLRHRLYITLHGRDRWYGLKNIGWKMFVSHILCTACFLATGAHGCGWCQGNACGKCQKTELIECCCED